MEKTVSEAEAQKLKDERDAKVAAIREDMGYAPAKDEAAPEVGEEKSPEPEGEAEEEEIPTTEAKPDGEEDVEDEEVEDVKPVSSLTRELNTIRSQKREIEAKAEADKVAWDTERTKLIQEREEMRKNLPPPQPFLDYAKKRNITDPKEVKELYDVFKNQLDVDYGTKLSAIEEKMQSLENQEVARAEAVAYDESMHHFDGEWREILPDLEAQYKPDAATLQKVYDLLADLSHSEKYTNYDLDAILYKERTNFEGILGSPKRKTFFSARGGIKESAERGQPTYGSEHEPIMALRGEQKRKMNANDGFARIKDDQI